MSNIVPIYYCSFCGKSEQDAEFIFTACKSDPRSQSICDKCVDLVTNKLAEIRLEATTESNTGNK